MIGSDHVFVICVHLRSMPTDSASSPSARVLIIGSGPNAVEARDWTLSVFDHIVVINNAWQVIDQWHDLIYPHDFPASRLPPALKPGQRLIDETAFVPAQNHYGGFVYAGGTMAFTAAYWVLHEYTPAQMYFIGCDMNYPKTGPTHFYGTGQPDPLRNDISLTSLEGSSARFQCLATQQNCAVFNLSAAPSRLIFPRRRAEQVTQPASLADIDGETVADCLRTEQKLGYFVEDGRYWHVADAFDPAQLKQLNERWLRASKHLNGKK